MKKLVRLVALLCLSFIIVASFSSLAYGSIAGGKDARDDSNTGGGTRLDHPPTDWTSLPYTPPPATINAYFFSNHYFNPNSNGKINFEFSGHLLWGTAEAKIFLCEKNTHLDVKEISLGTNSYWSGVKWTWDGLTVGKDYYFRVIKDNFGVNPMTFTLKLTQ
ncbi:MAG: hypothetical protein FWH17_07215 [Oscillospiraceae bacterium]|nr:hypothetical protein [Oscillospiraceae bacterium]